jgi:disulfide bond formation protein DsbB
MTRQRFDIAELLNGAGLVGLIVVLLVAYADQFAGHDLPCPLCLLQRVAVVGVAFGLLLNLRYGPQPSSYGIMLLAALFGMAVAGTADPAAYQPRHRVVRGAAARAAFLYVVVPAVRGGDPRHRHPAAAAATNITRAALPRQLQYGLAWAAIGMTALNAVTTFLQCGPLECPDNPVNYWAFAR